MFTGYTTGISGRATSRSTFVTTHQSALYLANSLMAKHFACDVCSPSVFDLEDSVLIQRRGASERYLTGRENRAALRTGRHHHNASCSPRLVNSIGERGANLSRGCKQRPGGARTSIRPEMRMSTVTLAMMSILSLPTADITQKTTVPKAVRTRQALTVG
jgi:hypothetical protein